MHRICKVVLAAPLLMSSFVVAAQQGTVASEAVSTSQVEGIALLDGIPRLVRFSGNLKQTNSTIPVLFSLYEEREGGTPLWQEVQQVQVDSQGKFTVLLGSTRKGGLPLSAFVSGKAHWLGVQVQPGQGQESSDQQPSDEEQRVLLVGVPYALKAADADTLGGVPASAYIHMKIDPKTGKAVSTKGATTDANSKDSSATNAAAPTGSGTTNYIPKWLSSSSLGNSFLYQTSTGIGLGTTAPVAKFQVIGSSPTTTIDGYNNAKTGSTFAVLGQADSTSGTGVYGKSTATSGATIGVRGLVASATGIAGAFTNMARGAAVNASDGSPLVAVKYPSVIESISGSGVSVVGYSNDTSGIGVAGVLLCNDGSCLTNAFATGVYGYGRQSYDTGVLGQGGGTGVEGDATQSGGVGVIARNTLGGDVFSAAGATGGCTVDASGDLTCTGTKSAAVKIATGQNVALYAVESPENWFEDFGSAKLVSGVATVNLESTFAETVNSTLDYHVFLTPNGDCRGLYVANKTATSFQVRELGNGRSNVSFDYRVVVRRKGYENVRLADVSSRMKSLIARPKQARHIASTTH